MKRIFAMSILAMAVVLFTTSVFATSTTLGDKVYNKGKDYGVEETDRVEMERYFTTHPTTDEEEAYVLGKADEVLAIMDAAGTKNVRDLSDSDLKKVEKLVQDAGNYIGLTICNFDISADGTVTFEVRRNGKIMTVVHKQAKGSSTSTSTARKFKYTGSNTTLAIASCGIIMVSVFAVVKLRKNV